MINAIKQATESSVTQGGQPLVAFIADVHPLGPGAARGLVLTEAFCWDQKSESRA